ncbi:MULTISPECIES: WYL domain-containing protein [Enterobacteriaceae]|uniref:WYL domain-containing protein n=1 Tax=Enterobacteriaceae TaxID=543 RepID=UPI0018042124|nr:MULTISPECIES: WYL domain-containing protein [Enterobacteriaceae]EFH3034535.1 WYL domain-containing protein [Escherichia coli]EGT0653162.1 WYL domain-containing protein [Citrobacter freundii]EID2750013.1 WYL domain-containing protein [Escherichia coli]EKU0541855.1 WYL domain-containing protein [Citrobacter koseri]EKU8894108.1 WYL domain-containing protein [Citrobacter koseri]
MTQTERRHDRLAIRLSLIISRLVAGETLDMRRLTAEFGVSARTLYRDFRERLMYLDLECSNGCYRLRTGVSGAQAELDVLTFAHRTGVADLFPGLDRRLVSLLLNCNDAPCLVGEAVGITSPSASLSFYRLVKAITACYRVTLLADGQRCERLAPYRLMMQEGHWYLIAEYQDRPAVFTLNEIHVVQPTTEIFRRNERLWRMAENTGFARALPHFRCIQQSLNAFTSP